MSHAELLAVAVALAMDAVAVSLALGLQLQRPDRRVALLAAAMFGGFQGLMPVLGWGLSFWFADAVSAVTPWVAFVLLALIGGKMVLEGIRDETEDAFGDVTVLVLLPLAIATSIDAAAVGVTFAFLDVAVLPAVVLIGVVTFVLSLGAVLLGARVGEHLGRWATLAGGTVLVLIGLRILLAHLL
ncbi:manganese efflux pump MntP family protein [Nocardioides panacisoli]|uniref:manganese efflux pump MntP n=1 Tax=Nocardioides panacisoli TaxID=627624 RepID=UPI001C631CF4|nr:manganese efflux pump MntP family protein [Nocardioides panacisoli]QYJ05350.1 manganese efflux pump MntP family protein [Nocardioides panacisoli]